MKEDQIKIMEQYIVTGVPSSLLDRMCEEANLDRAKLQEFMFGQTMGLVGGEGIVYPWDLRRFINGLPNID